MNFLWVFLGGGAGSILRYGIGLLAQKLATTLPVATFISNLSACFIFGICLSVLQQKEISSASLRLLILTGFCGGLSTFSTFGYETYLLMARGQLNYAILNSVFSVAACITIFYLFRINIQ